MKNSPKANKTQFSSVSCFSAAILIHLLTLSISVVSSMDDRLCAGRQVSDLARELCLCSEYFSSLTLGSGLSSSARMLHSGLTCVV